MDGGVGHRPSPGSILRPRKRQGACRRARTDGFPAFHRIDREGPAPHADLTLNIANGGFHKWGFP